MQIMEGERQSDAIKAIFAKSSCPEFTSEAFTAVNYHNKCPSFYDEFKVALPADLRQNHHILFTLYHVSCQKKPLEVQTNVETPVGFTVSLWAYHEEFKLIYSYVSFVVATDSQGW